METKKGRIGMNEIEPSELLSFPKRETRPAKRRQALSVWPVSHAHGLSFFLSHPMVFFIPHSPFGQLFIKTKKKPRHAGKTKAAEGRRVTGVSEVGKQDRGGRFHLGVSQILVRNFYVGNTGNLRNFYVEIAFGYCQ